ncbi:C-type lectin BiL-like isoform X2 [Biomphalaria pfeifferi]|uniref:C-type lectin BiL-like isoform X2 n=1 Tax=Biomphalaria pfeifferi TaxID=112525 RepID=A0AAD8C2J9_BIOPF|nr:C-type lectin BiL-like isoform X2 [Biomphalaria pfeifferi]
MTLTLHGVLSSFTLISLLLQVYGQTENCPTVDHILSTGKCYRIYRISKSWAQAKVECDELNSSLAEFESQEQALKVMYKQQSSFWIGIYDFKRDRSWVWISDNKTVNMAYWNQSPEYVKNDTCGYMFNSGGPKIFAKNCAFTIYYICMSLPIAPATITNSTTETLATTSTSTTEAPAITTNSPTEAPDTTTTSTTVAPATTTTSTTEAPAITTNSPTEAPDTTTTSTTVAPATTTTSTTEAPAITTNSPTEAPDTTTTSPTEAPDTTTTSPTEAPDTTTTSPTEAPDTTTTSTTVAPATTITSSKETTSLGLLMSTYSSSQIPTTSLTMSTITNINSQMENTLGTTTKCRGVMRRALMDSLALGVNTNVIVQKIVMTKVHAWVSNRLVQRDGSDEDVSKRILRSMQSYSLIML